MVLARRAESLELDAQINTGASWFSSELLARLLYLQVIDFPIFLIIEIAKCRVTENFLPDLAFSSSSIRKRNLQRIFWNAYLTIKKHVFHKYGIRISFRWVQVRFHTANLWRKDVIRNLFWWTIRDSSFCRFHARTTFFRHSSYSDIFFFVQQAMIILRSVLKKSFRSNIIWRTTSLKKIIHWRFPWTNSSFYISFIFHSLMISFIDLCAPSFLWYSAESFNAIYDVLDVHFTKP